mmetsp:Transcript_15521/g.33610  ORF Transcript_15521/g.33610 Transcript_15521/m.33610 type:complete len:459 (-) Transcript_15521:1495-2871(-)
MLEEVPRLDHAKLGVRVLVVPHQRGLPRLHKRPRRALAEVVEHQLDRLEPVHAHAVGGAEPLRQLLLLLLLLARGRPQEDAVLRGEPHGEAVELVLEARPPAAGEDDQRHVRHRRYHPQRLYHRRMHLGHVLLVVEVALGPPLCGLHGVAQRGVAENDQPLLRVLEARHHLRHLHHGRRAHCADGRLHMGVVQLRHKRVRPRLAGVDGDVHEVLAVALAALGVAHGERLLDGGGEVAHVPGVDQDGPRAQALRRPRKLRQHQHPRVLRLARHHLVRHQVHAVADGRDERDVGEGVERAQLVEAEAAVEVVDGHGAQRAEAPVDAPHHLVHQAGQPLVLRHVRARGHRDLHQQHAVAPGGVLVEEHFVREQLLGDAFDHVQPVHPQHHLAAAEALLELLNVRLHNLRLQRLREPLRVDAYGERRHPRHLPVVLHSLRRTLQAQDARAGAHKVPCVVVCV